MERENASLHHCKSIGNASNGVTGSCGWRPRCNLARVGLEHVVAGGGDEVLVLVERERHPERQHHVDAEREVHERVADEPATRSQDHFKFHGTGSNRMQNGRPQHDFYGTGSNRTQNGREIGIQNIFPGRACTAGWCVRKGLGADLFLLTPTQLREVEVPLLVLSAIYEGRVQALGPCKQCAQKCEDEGCKNTLRGSDNQTETARKTERE
eukprot:3603682-Rhodomonas_salina.2